MELSPTRTPYRTRFAPSPTGRTHLGHARTALLAWLRARSQAGQVIMRMEDIDLPRVREGAEEAIYQDMRWLGLDWDEGPDVGGQYGPYRQSEREDLYLQALADLREEGRLFACSCTRRELQEASAPHGGIGRRYPGTCHDGVRHPDRASSLRFRMVDPSPGFEDQLSGHVEPGVATDDFVVRRSDGLFAYQLAVVVDDAAMGMTEVIRADDLLHSTPLQLALFEALGVEPPRYLHIPLVMGEDGTRLSKRHGSTSIAEYRDAGWSSERVVATLARSLGIDDAGEEISPKDLIPRFELSKVSREPWVAPVLSSS